MALSRANIAGWFILVFVVIAAGAGVFAWWCMASLPVPVEAAEHVTSGMSKDAVRSVLGDPSEIRTDLPQGTQRWIYSHPCKWTFYTVYFAPNGTVASAEYAD